MRILMFGPGKGHNIRKFFDYFDKRPEEYQVTYYYFTPQVHYPLKQFRNIRFIHYFDAFRLLFALRRRNEVIWVHNWTPILVLLFILLFRNRKAFLNFNIWSEPVPRKAQSKGFKGRIYRWFFRQCDQVQCNWFGTQEILKGIKGVDPVVVPWGLNEEFFQEIPPEICDEAKDFVATLSKEKTNFFFPKSLAEGTGHELIVKASSKLVAQGVKGFCVYFWVGNNFYQEVHDRIAKLIKDEGVEENVVIYQHSFMPASEIAYIWKAVDCGFQLMYEDQLSSTFLEPLYFKKELIANDIFPYKKFKAQFDLDLDLVPLQADPIMERMEGVITEKEQASPVEKEYRSKVVELNFRFQKNLESNLQNMLRKDGGRKHEFIIPNKTEASTS